MKAIPKNYCASIEKLAERPDVLHMYCYHIDCFKKGVGYLADRVLNTLAGDFNTLEFDREVAQTYLKWKESLYSADIKDKSARNFMPILRQEIIARIKLINIK